MAAWNTGGGWQRPNFRVTQVLPMLRPAVSWRPLLPRPLLWLTCVQLLRSVAIDSWFRLWRQLLIWDRLSPGSHRTKRRRWLW